MTGKTLLKVLKNSSSGNSPRRGILRGRIFSRNMAGLIGGWEFAKGSIIRIPASLYALCEE